MKTNYPKIIDRQDRLKLEFLERFKKTPIIQVVCEKTGISRTTYYRWIKEDPIFYQRYLEAEKEGREFMNDGMESTLIQQARAGNTTALIFYMKHNNPRYSESFGALTPIDIVDIANYIENSNSEQNDFQFLSRLFRKRIPIKVGRYILQIIRNLTKIKEVKQDEKKMNFLSRIMGSN
ncbi:MAG: hypothetical protein AAB441_00985 [Patescibacteria group bacterium]